MLTAPSNAQRVQPAPRGFETYSGLKVPMRTTRAPHASMTVERAAQALVRIRMQEMRLDGAPLRRYVCEQANDNARGHALDRVNHALVGDRRLRRCTLIASGWTLATADYMTARGLVKGSASHPTRVKVIPDKGTVATYDWDALIELVAAGRL